MSYQQLECDYFNLYNQFISVDFTISLEKNNRILVKDFVFFYHQILKQKDLNYLFGVRNKIALKVQNYMQKYSIMPKNLHVSCLRENKHIEFFEMLYKALVYFVAFRQKLNGKQKIQILISSIDESFGYHFLIENFQNLKHFQESDILTLPERCLNHFHLAMVHLCIIILNPLNLKDYNRHLDKAINYLIDGTFNIYEIILKEYSVLYPKDKNLKQDLLQLKELEFKTLIQEISKIKLINNYKELCREILYNLELEKII
ncbi:hypothetical protein [Campylobacter estrildidarum]|uniref:Uncharacterized protein n=1 Tax=Campylobacter estrildidarum TaxID=2510189 RepID=A0A4U7BRH2_9BACT|nr:hypothetical protein [Campylobacter estrildidarum]TKX31314.1 hypothetical protein CQA69_03465 [Campylobacter estrildidarum]